jgi:ABC-2 type transport system permease protein
MPWPIQAITYLVHSRYYVTILKAVFLKGAGLIELAMPMSLLALYAVAVAFLAARAFRKTLD